MSPYENRLERERFRRIGLVSSIQPGANSELDNIISSKPSNLHEQLEATGIHNPHIYVKGISGKEVLYIYFETENLDQEAAIQSLKQSSPWWSSLEAVLLSPRPSSNAENQPWARAELINVIAANPDLKRDAGQPMGLVSGLKPEQELWYRTLHQTNWPGVIDQMRRSHYQNWTTFLIDWDGKLLLLTHVEYLGSDITADNKAMAQDPVTQRWWTHTQPCLYSLIPDSDKWIEMTKL